MHITFFKLFFIYACITWLIDVSFGLLYVNILDVTIRQPFLV